MTSLTSACEKTGVKKNDSSNKTTVVNKTLVSKGQHLSLVRNRTKFIDSIGNNYLYRGSLPIENKNFALQEVLISMISEESRKTPVNKSLAAPLFFPEPIFLVDFNLLFSANPHEKDDIDIEKNFFLKYPEIGEFVHYDANAIFIEGLSTGKVGELIDHAIVNLRTRLSDVNNEPLIIYVHCEAGLDRTGVITAGYAMRYLEYSYTEAFAINATLDLRDQNATAKIATKLYAKYLEDVVGIKTIGDID